MEWNIDWKNIEVEKPNIEEACLVLCFSMDIDNPNEWNDASVSIGFFTEHNEFITAQFQYLEAKYYIPLPLKIIQSNVKEPKE